MPGLGLAIHDLGTVARIQRRRGLGIGSRVELAPGQAELGRRAGHELEQAFGTAAGVVGVGIEVATGFDIRKAQKVLARDTTALGLTLDYIENLASVIRAGHHWLLR
ncbi:hypothetical protein D3C71_1148880 [compost metagenome]